MAPSTYRGRLAPSPTGDAHFGTARTALCAWLCARAAGGRLVLRVEDLDAPRVVPSAAERIARDLRWLGLDWDEGPDVGGAYGPYAQSRRTQHYTAAIDSLRAAGRLFACSCSRAEVAAAASAPHADQDLGPRYPGTCRQGPTRAGRPCSLRFSMPRAPAFEDRLFGAQAETEGDDFVVQRVDGVFAYQLAVVVDDIAMGITEVVRGADLLGSTARQVALHRALGAAPPAFLHVPLVVGPDGTRLAKRHGAIAIASLRAAGQSPARVVGALAHSLGLAARDEAALPAQLVGRFDPAALPRAPYVLAGTA